MSTFVVTSRCRDCKYTSCVDVCPADAFHEGPQYLVINPDACISCGACVYECPVEAIFEESEVPESERDWIEKNAKEAGLYPMILASQNPLKGPSCIDSNAD